MSVGSETGRLSSGAVAFAQRYGTVILWMDKAELAKQLMTQVPGSFGFGSPGGKDANDLLQAGALGAQVVKLRWGAARTVDERMRLTFDLWDAAHFGGIDRSTARAYQAICKYVGRRFDLVEGESGCWQTQLALAKGVEEPCTSKP